MMQKKGHELEKKYAAAGFVLSIFRSAALDATLTLRGQKEFAAEFYQPHWAWKHKNVLKLCSLPQNSALWPSDHDLNM